MPPCPTHQKNLGQSGSKPNFMRPSGRRSFQARPFALDRLDRPVDRFLEPVDGGGDVDLLRRGIAGVDRGLVERADPDAVVALALEIEAFVEVGDERQVPKAAPPTRSCTTVRRFGTRPMPVTPARVAHLLAPGAGGVDENRRGHRAGAGLDDPASIGLPRAQQFGIGPHDAAPPAHCGQAGVVEGRHLDVGAGRFIPGAGPLRRRPGISRSSAARSRWTGANSRRCRPAPRTLRRRHGSDEPPRACAAKAIRSPANGRRTAAGGRGVRRRSGVSPPRLACQKAADRPVAWRPHNVLGLDDQDAPVYD